MKRTRSEKEMEGRKGGVRSERAASLHSNIHIHSLEAFTQGSTIRPFPGCENAAGKLRQKW